MKKINLKVLPNLNSIQFQFLKNKLPLEMTRQIAQLKNLRSIKYWDIPKGSGIENVAQCKKLEHIATEMYPITMLEFISLQRSNVISLSLDLSISSDFSTANFVDSCSVTLKPELRDLSFTLNEFNDQILEAISASCPKLVTLVIKEAYRVQICFDQVTSAAIAATFESCKHLRTLKIISTKAEQLANKIQSNQV
jgi:hypothetical protein